MILRVLPGHGLVVSVPRRFARRDIPAVVEAHREWAESALADLARRTPAACLVWPPESLALRAVDRQIVVAWDDVDASMGRRAASLRADDTLAITVTKDDREGVATAIATVLRAEGRRLLVPRLAEHARRLGLGYARVAVRGQRSVWGSCSSSGTISLNYKLLFLPPEIVDYVLVHELAHTRYLDHSPAFWSFLEGLEPETRRLDQALRLAGSLVPPWLELANGT